MLFFSTPSFSRFNFNVLDYCVFQRTCIQNCGLPSNKADQLAFVLHIQKEKELLWNVIMGKEDEELQRFLQFEGVIQSDGELCNSR